MQISVNNNKDTRHVESEETESKMSFSPKLVDDLTQLEISIEDDDSVRITGVFDDDETKTILRQIAEHFDTERNRGMNESTKKLTIAAGEFKFTVDRTTYGDPFQEGLHFGFDNDKTFVRCFVASWDARDILKSLTKTLNTNG
jgi:hypothetical protein